MEKQDGMQISLSSKLTFLVWNLASLGAVLHCLVLLVSLTMGTG
jgi:hypothetical protein